MSPLKPIMLPGIGMKINICFSSFYITVFGVTSHRFAFSDRKKVSDGLITHQQVAVKKWNTLIKGVELEQQKKATKKTETSNRIT